MSWLPSTGGSGADPQTAVNTADIATIEGEQTTQDGLIAANTAKVSYTDAADVAANTAKISYTDAAAVAANTAKISYSDAALVATHTTDIGTNAADIATNVTAIALNTAKTGITSGESAKLAHLTVTQAVDLDSIETRVNELDASVVLMGTWDASAGTFPGSGSASSGQSWIVSVAGTVDGVAFVVNDRLLAIVDPASASTYAANWHKLDYTDQVLSVGGLTGAVSDVDVVSGGVAGAGTDSVVIGPAAASAGDSSVAVGRQASAAGHYSTSAGWAASAGGANSTAVGRLASAAGSVGSAFGHQASAGGGYSLAAAWGASAGGDYSVALGEGATVSAVARGVAIGPDTNVTGVNATAAGYFATATALGSGSFGALSDATATNAYAIGYNITAATADTVSVNNLEVQGNLQVVGGFEPADTRTWHTRTLVPDDANRTTMFSNSALTTVTIPLNSAEPFAIGAQFALHSTGAGGVTLSTTGITINGSSPNTTIAQNEVMVLEKTGTDTWSVYGGTSA